MAFSILKKSTRRRIGIAAAIGVTGVIIYGFLSAYQQAKNNIVPKVNLVQAAIYGSERTATVPLLYEAVEGEQCIRQLTFATAASSQAASSNADATAIASAVAQSSPSSAKSTSSQPSFESLVPQLPLVNASSPKCLQQTPAPEGYEKLGAEGSVVLALNLTNTGRVEHGEVEKSSGFADLDAAALKQVRETWEFKPCKQAEKAVACRHYIRFRWQIK